MSNKSVCGRNKHELGEITGTIYLPVSIENLPEKVEVKGHTLYLPAPFHVSLVYIGLLTKKYNITIPDFQEKVINDFCAFTKTHDIDIVRYKNEFRFVQKENKTTVVVMCEMSNHDVFFDFINEKYNLDIKYPIPHVTLYNTQKSKPGVALMDKDEIKNHTELIENPIGRSLNL